MANKKSILCVNNLEDLKNNSNYKEYSIQKDKIKKKYPKDLWNRPSGGRISSSVNYTNHHLWKEYLKDIADLLHQKDGWYQKFVWDTMSESDRKLLDKKFKD